MAKRNKNKPKINRDEGFYLPKGLEDARYELKLLRSRLTSLRKSKNPRTSIYIQHTEQMIFRIKEKYPELRESYLKKRKYKKVEEKKLSDNDLDAFAKDIINQIKKEFFFNKKEIISFNDIKPLIGNKEFIDLVVRAKIPFTSTRNKYFANALSDTLNYLSDKKGLGKGGNRFAGKHLTTASNDFAQKIGPRINLLEEEGFMSLQSKADKLNEEGIKTLRGKQWTSMAIKNTFERWQKLKEEENKKSNSPKP